MVRITHYRYKCIGCTYCVEVASQYWRMSEIDGKSDLLGAKTIKNMQVLITDDMAYKENKKAAELCPVSCIKVEKK